MAEVTSIARETAGWVRKDLLGLEDLSREEIELVLATADSFKEISLRPIKKVPTLRGRTVANFFFEASTRTRTSFELAAKRLSADVINVTASSSSVTKGESLIDTVHNLEALKVDIIVMRHPCSGAPHLLSRRAKASVINAGDGSHEHPTQALLDLFTLKERKGRIEGLKVAIVGDIRHSRVARSNLWGLTKLGAKVTVCGPPTLIPAGIEELGVGVTYDLGEALKDADAVILLRLQLERMKEKFFPSIGEYASLYGIDEAKLKAAPKDLIVLHPGPINRGIELSDAVADGPQSVILDQVTNGLAVRMACLYLVSGGAAEEAA